MSRNDSGLPEDFVFNRDQFKEGARFVSQEWIVCVELLDKLNKYGNVCFGCFDCLTVASVSASSSQVVV